MQKRNLHSRGGMMGTQDAIRSMNEHVKKKECTKNARKKQSQKLLAVNETIGAEKWNY